MKLSYIKNQQPDAILKSTKNLFFRTGIDSENQIPLVTLSNVILSAVEGDNRQNTQTIKKLSSGTLREIFVPWCLRGKNIATKTRKHKETQSLSEFNQPIIHPSLPVIQSSPTVILSGVEGDISQTSLKRNILTAASRCPSGLRVPLLTLLLSLTFFTLSAQEPTPPATPPANSSTTTTAPYSRFQVDTLIESIRGYFDELLDVEIGWTALQTRHISNVGYGIDNSIGLNGELRDTLEFLRTVFQSELFVKSVLQFDHLWTRLINRSNYSPGENELSRQHDELYARKLYFDIKFIPAWDTVALTVDQAREQNKIAFNCTITVNGLGNFTAELSDEEMETLLNSIIKEKSYTKIKRDAEPDVNAGMFAGLGWLGEKFGFKPFEDPVNIKRVDFYAPVAQKYGYDQFKTPQLSNNYENISVKGVQYYIPWKSAAVGKTDSVYVIVKKKTADRTTGDTLQFVTTTGQPLNTVTRVNDTIYRLMLLPAGSENEYGIQATYSYKDSTGKDVTVIAGQANIAGYQEQPMRVVLVPVEGISHTLSAIEIQEELNRIYRQAATSWTVSITDPITLTGIYDDGKLDDGESSLLSNFTEEMNDVIDAFEDQSELEIDNETCYLFLVNKPKSGTDKAGYMPLKRQFGFIFVDNAGAGIERTIAHELGHGPFRLYHTFSSENQYTQQKGQTDNLMDYTDGAFLYKYQWDLIHDPEAMIALLQDEGEGEGIVINLTEIPADYRNDDGSISFLAPSGQIITLPSGTQMVEISVADPLFYVKTGELYEKNAPVGSLLSFMLDYNSYGLRLESGDVKYLCKKIDKYYTDEISPRITIKNVLIGFPFYSEFEGIKFSIYKIPQNQSASSVSPPMILPAQGQLTKNSIESDKYGTILNDVFTIVDKLQNSNSAVNEIGKGISYFFNSIGQISGSRPSLPISIVTGDDLSPLGNDYLKKHSQYCSTSNALGAIIVSNAFWVSFLQGSEATTSCDIDNTDKRLAELNEYLSQLEKKICIMDTKVYNEEVTNYALNLYHSFRSQISTTNSQTATIANLNSKLSIATITPTDVFNLLESVSDCELEGLSIESRIKAINLLSIDDSNDEENENIKEADADDEDIEELIIRLVYTTKYNSQSIQLTTRIFENKGELFFRLYDRLDFSEFNKYISKITEILRLDNMDKEPEYSMSFSENIGPLGGYFEFDWLKDEGKVTIRKMGREQMNTSGVNSGYSGLTPPMISLNYGETPYDLTTFIKVKFPKTDSYIKLYADKENNDEEVILPAFYVAYLIKSESFSSTMKKVRIGADVVAICLAIPSGGSSLTLLGGIGIGLASTDIVITLSEDVLNQTEYGKAIIDAWNVIQWVDLSVGVVNLGKTFTKCAYKSSSGVIKTITEGGELTIKLNAKQIASNFGELCYKKSIEAIRATVWNLQRMSLNASSSFLYKKILAELDAAAMENVFTARNANIKLTFTDWVECSVEMDGKATKLFDLQNASTGAYVKTTVKDVMDQGDEIVGEFGTIRYYDEGSKVIKESPAKVAYKASTGEFYLAKKALDLSWIDNLAEGWSATTRTALKNELIANPDLLKNFTNKSEGAYNWKLLWESYSNPGSVTDPLFRKAAAIKALGDIRTVPTTVRTQLGLTDEVLASIRGNSKASYEVVINDIKKVADKVKDVPTTQFTNLREKVINKLLKNSDATNSQRIGAHGVIKALNDDFDIISGKTVKFEESVNNIRGTTSYEDITVEITVVDESTIFKRIEVKNCDNCITQDVIVTQFIERDLFNATSINQLRWRIYEQSFTKNNLIAMLSSPEGRSALGNLNNSGRLQALFPSAKIGSVDDFINMFKDEKIFSSIFK